MAGTIIFDWDGTLHDTAHLYGCAFRTAYTWLEQGGYVPDRIYSDEDVSVFLGMNAMDMWDAFMQRETTGRENASVKAAARRLRAKGMTIPLLPEAVKNRASAMIGEEMVRAVRAGHARLYPGVPGMLDLLRRQGYHLVFLSNCKRAYMQAHREQFQLDRWFSGFYCCEDYGFATKEQIFPDIRARFPDVFLVVGDRASDMQVAQVHHLRAVGCAYGYGIRQGGGRDDPAGESGEAVGSAITAEESGETGGRDDQIPELAGADRIACCVEQIPGLAAELALCL